MRRTIGAIALLALLIGGLAWVNRGRPAPRRTLPPEAVPKTVKLETPAKPEAAQKPAETANPTKLAKARLVRFVNAMKAKDAWYFDRTHPGTITRLARDADLVATVDDLKRELGAEFGPVLREVLAGLKSPSYRSLVALILGVGRDTGSSAVLGGMLEEDGSASAFAAASLGFIRAPEGVEALKRFYVKRTDVTRLNAELGLALAGEIPLLIDEARREVAKRPPLDPKNLKYANSDRWFAWAGAATDDIVALTADGVNMHLRVAAFNALARAGEAGVEKLMELCETRADDREAILGILMQTHAYRVEGSAAVLDRLLDTDDPAIRVQQLVMAASSKSPKAESWLKEHWVELMTAAPKEALAFQVGFMGREDLVHEVLASATENERARLIVQGFRGLPDGLNDPDLIAEVAEAVTKARTVYDLRTLLNICPKVKGDAAPLLRAMEVSFGSATPDLKVDVLHYASQLGVASESFLRRVVSEDADPVMRVAAARGLLQIVKRDGELAEFLKRNVPDLTKPQGAQRSAFDRRTYGGITYDDYPALLRDFYGTFGTREDFELLRGMADQVVGDASPADAGRYREWVRSRCREAEDEVILRHEPY